MTRTVGLVWSTATDLVSLYYGSKTVLKSHSELQHLRGVSRISPSPRLTKIVGAVGLQLTVRRADFVAPDCSGHIRQGTDGLWRPYALARFMCCVCLMRQPRIVRAHSGDYRQNCTGMDCLKGHFTPGEPLRCGPIIPSRPHAI